MQKCSLSNRRRSFEDDVPISDRTLEINSHISVPCHLEQCLNLKVNKIRLLFFCFFLIGRNFEFEDNHLSVLWYDKCNFFGFLYN